MVSAPVWIRDRAAPSVSHRMARVSPVAGDDYAFTVCGKAIRAWDVADATGSCSLCDEAAGKVLEQERALGIRTPGARRRRPPQADLGMGRFRGSFVADLDPVPKGRPRFSKFGPVRTPDATKAYERQLRIEGLRHAPGAPLEGLLQARLVFVFPRLLAMRRKRDPDALVPHGKRPDLDNLVKAVLDALGPRREPKTKTNNYAGAWFRDDGQVTRVDATKFYAERDGRARVEVTIEEYTDE